MVGRGWVDGWMGGWVDGWVDNHRLGRSVGRVGVHLSTPPTPSPLRPTHIPIRIIVLQTSKQASNRCYVSQPARSESGRARRTAAVRSSAFPLVPLLRWKRSRRADESKSRRVTERRRDGVSARVRANERRRTETDRQRDRQRDRRPPSATYVSFGMLAPALWIFFSSLAWHRGREGGIRRVYTVAAIGVFRFV